MVVKMKGARDAGILSFSRSSVDICQEFLLLLIFPSCFSLPGMSSDKMKFRDTSPNCRRECLVLLKDLDPSRNLDETMG